MFRIKCDRCDKELKEPGGLLFSPPKSKTDSVCTKWHLCKECYLIIELEIGYAYIEEKSKKS